MPGQRAPGQRQILIWIRKEFLAEIDRAVPRLGYNDRASLIRDSVYEKLNSMGYNLPPEIKTAPSRAGKGGARKRAVGGASEEMSLAAEAGAPYKARKKPV